MFSDYINTGVKTDSLEAIGDNEFIVSINIISPQSAISENKTMLVTENLKFRSGEATSTQVLTVMSAGTKVKILELGKAETIDGISSNWVKVEVQTEDVLNKADEVFIKEFVSELQRILEGNEIPESIYQDLIFGGTCDSY